ncbi:MocR-like pyridoxine biosynthesis transcription factor PdxR [Paenibacillus alkalitolerans]|uniref:MocR-like pyridoxine biosynthesis transcription factor PdxR n=1 Tax=Paenibacillus alkalitolerans TaxID=2799335 RepID=UPI0018F54409|nr:PLP-dependent aminotransferase family protein [Paenibacillus alkalitolerans]
MFGFRQGEHQGSVMMQLCTHLRAMIESGDLQAGFKLPPTRTAAQELGIARSIIIEVYEQLIAEGYLDSRVGSGTFVAGGIQVRFRRLAEPGAWQIPAESARIAANNGVIDFRGGAPDPRLFPRRLWGKYLRETADRTGEELLDYGDIRGDSALRSALASYLFRVKGIRCHPEQVVIVSGSSEGFLLIATACSQMVRTVYVEEPTIDIVPAIFRRIGYTLSPVDVDEKGMDIDRIGPEEPGGLLVLTPSHQYPTGSVLPIQRRQQVVRLAEAAGHYIIEDDYDSEFRHSGVPIPPLQTLAPSRVIYSGTFSKTLSPSLRLGFLVLPPQLADTVIRTKADLNLFAPTIAQHALAKFIKDGHFDRHVQRMKQVYKRRRGVLAEALKRHFGDGVDIRGDEAGMHLQASFEEGRCARLKWEEAEAFGVRLNSLEDYALGKGRHHHQVVLGYGKLDDKEIAEGVARLRRFIIGC